MSTLEQAVEEKDNEPQHKNIFHTPNKKMARNILLYFLFWMELSY